MEQKNVTICNQELVIDIDELKDFIEIHSMEPEQDDTPYIVAHTVEELDHYEEGQRYFINILISCRTLINRILRDPTNKQLIGQKKRLAANSLTLAVKLWSFQLFLISRENVNIIRQIVNKLDAKS